MLSSTAPADIMKPDEGAYYVTHGRISDPGARAMRLIAMPSDPEQLVTAVPIRALLALTPVVFVDFFAPLTSVGCFPR